MTWSAHPGSHEIRALVGPNPTEEAPLLAHIGSDTPSVAICGKRIMGIPAPDSAPLCVVCDELTFGEPA